MSQRRSAIFADLAATTYDLLIVGGGITGAGIVRDAAGRGLRCLLVEKADFASGTSSKSGKLIHGGLRYLKYWQWGLVFEACRERWLLQTRIAPHLVRPVPLCCPVLCNQPHSCAGCWPRDFMMYELLALGRNRGHFHLLSRTQLAEVAPGLDQTDCRGGVSYFDCAAPDFRLVIDTLKSSERHGARICSTTRNSRKWQVPTSAARRRSATHFPDGNTKPRAAALSMQRGLGPMMCNRGSRRPSDSESSWRSASILSFPANDCRYARLSRWKCPPMVA